MSDYKPLPPDTTLLEGRPDLLPLIEELSALVHDAWSASRMAGDWKYGPERDEKLRLHPSLVPYEELSDEMKELDRASVRSTIVALLQLGYDIKR